MTTRHTLAWIICLVLLCGAAFFSGFNWPKSTPGLVVSQTKSKSDLMLNIQGGKITGTAPDNSSVMLNKTAMAPGETFSFDLTQAWPLHWWSKDWALILDLKGSQYLSNLTTQEQSGGSTPEEGIIGAENFVASKSGSKYHPIEGCHFADRIKPENRVYFQTKEQAEQAGYEPSSCFNS